MKRNNYLKYYRVFKNDTTVTEISANNFMPVVARGLKHLLPVDKSDNAADTAVFAWSLPSDDKMFYGYSTRAHAMQKAKDGAMSYINQLTTEGGPGQLKLEQYREDHYQDLNVTLLDANIRRIENETITN